MKKDVKKFEKFTKLKKNFARMGGRFVSWATGSTHPKVIGVLSEVYNQYEVILIRV